MPKPNHFRSAAALVSVLALGACTQAMLTGPLISRAPPAAAPPPAAAEAEPQFSAPRESPPASNAEVDIVVEDAAAPQAARAPDAITPVASRSASDDATRAPDASPAKPEALDGAGTDDGGDGGDDHDGKTAVATKPTGKPAAEPPADLSDPAASDAAMPAMIEAPPAATAELIVPPTTDALPVPTTAPAADESPQKASPQQVPPAPRASPFDDGRIVEMSSGPRPASEPQFDTPASADMATAEAPIETAAAPVEQSAAADGDGDGAAAPPSELPPSAGEPGRDPAPVAAAVPETPARDALADLGAVVSDGPRPESWFVHLPGHIGTTVDADRLWQAIDAAADEHGAPPHITFAGGDLGRLDTLDKVQILDLSAAEWIADFGPLARLTGLEALTLSKVNWPSGPDNGLASLAALDKLRVLDLSDAGRLDTINGLAAVGQLRSLTITDASVASLAPLAGLRNLVYLDLSRAGPIVDLSPLADLRRLEIVNLSGLTGVADLDPLAGLERLTRLDITGVEAVTDLSPLAGLDGLAELSMVFAHGIETFDGVAELSGLTALYAGGTLHALDLSPLARLDKLEILDLNCSSGVTDLEPVAALGRLKTFRLRCTDRIDIRPLSSLARLETLDLSGNGLVDVGTLVGLSSLRELSLTDNPDLRSLLPLAELPNLTTLAVDNRLAADVARTFPSRPAGSQPLTVFLKGAAGTDRVDIPVAGAAPADNPNDAPAE